MLYYIAFLRKLKFFNMKISRIAFEMKRSVFVIEIKGEILIYIFFLKSQKLKKKITRK